MRTRHAWPSQPSGGVLALQGQHNYTKDAASDLCGGDHFREVAMIVVAARRGGASVFDLVIAATAERHRLAVLHDDRDYEVISQVTGLPTQRVTD